MGVSLERVQNKFACIIGELCSEPFILSQFAIWLDLRLAEYKAKGAISLEISGEEPDPSWLKGHKPSPPSMPSVDSGNLIPDMYDPTGGGDSKFDSVNMHMGRCDDRLSPDVVVLKDEPEESYRGSVYPVSLHGNSRIGGLQLKRTHTDSLSSGSNIHRSSMSSSPSPSKIHRPSSLSADSAPTNQSLMSIISDRDDSTQVYETPESQSSTHGTPQSKGDNFLSSYVVSDTPESSSPLPSSSNPRVPDPLASDSTDWLSEDNLRSVQQRSWNPSAVEGPVVVPEYISDVHAAELRHMYPRVYPECLSSKSVRSTIKYTEFKTRGALSDIVKIVGTLRRWLWSKYGETRDLQDIPAIELDNYLAEFFPKMRKSDGSDIHPRFLENLRSALARYLLDHGYPNSITKSHIFAKSSSSFSDRRKLLFNAIRQSR